MNRGGSHFWLGWGWLFGLTIFGLTLGYSGIAFGQSAKPDFSLIDPVWAAAQMDRNFTQDAGGAAWRALKRDYPQDYEAFIKAYVAALLTHQNTAPISGEFLQSHLRLAILVAPFAPSPYLARLQRAKAAAIEILANTDVESCAAFAVGDEETFENGIQGNLGDGVLRAAAELEAALFDAAAAAKINPKSRRIMNAEDIKVLKKVALALGNTPEDVGAMLSRPPESKQERCRLGVLFYRAIAAAPEDTAAKFAFK